MWDYIRKKEKPMKNVNFEILLKHVHHEYGEPIEYPLA